MAQRRNKGWDNLKLRPNADPTRIFKAMEKRKKHEADLAIRIENDPHASLRSTWEKTTAAIDVLLSKWLRTGGMPSAELLDALKEYRQQTKSITAWMRQQGVIAEADNFFTRWADGINGQQTQVSDEEDPEMVLVRVHAKLTQGTNRLVDKWTRSQNDPMRLLVEVMSELRQTTEAVAEYRGSLGVVTEAESWLANVEARTATANLEEGIRPYSPAA